MMNKSKIKINIKGKRGSFICGNIVAEGLSDIFYKEDVEPIANISFKKSVLYGDLFLTASYNSFFKKCHYNHSHINLVNSSSSTISLDLDNIARQDYVHIIFENTEKEIVKTPLSINCNSFNYSNIIGFNQGLKNHSSVLTYGFRDGTTFNLGDYKYLYKYGHKTLKSININTIVNIKELTINTHRLIAEMIDFYKKETKIELPVKILLVTSLINKLKILTKVTSGALSLGYTLQSGIEEVSNPHSNSLFPELLNHNSATTLNDTDNKPTNIESTITKSTITKSKDINIDLSQKDSPPIEVINDEKITNKTKNESLILEFRSYSHDLVKMMNRPILVDRLDPIIKDFNLLCIEIENNEKDINHSSFLNEWLSIQAYADMKQQSNFTSHQKLKLKDAKTMLDKALHENTNEHEVKTSVKGLINSLEGVLPVNDKVMHWIKNQTGLKEIKE